MPEPRFYPGFPPQHAQGARAGLASTPCALYNMFDSWGNGFVGNPGSRAYSENGKHEAQLEKVAELESSFVSRNRLLHASHQVAAVNEAPGGQRKISRQGSPAGELQPT